ncbi:MAG: 30S ribosomal protein S19 [Opitutales bacterium]
MARSQKKGFYVDPGLWKKIKAAEATDDRRPIKTWSRRSIITPEFVGCNLDVYNGKVFMPVHVTENMVGHRLGEFSPTRSFRGHAGVGKK